MTPGLSAITTTIPLGNSSAATDLVSPSIAPNNARHLFNAVIAPNINVDE